MKMSQAVCFIFLVVHSSVQSFDQIYFKLLKSNARLYDKISAFNNTSRFLCATVCEANACTGFLFAKNKVCQVLLYHDDIEKTEKGTCELWVLEFYFVAQESQKIILVDQGTVYWYNYHLGYSERMSKLTLPKPADSQTTFLYDKKTKRCYWYFIGMGIYSAVLKIKNVTSVGNIIREGFFDDFDIDFSRGMFFFAHFAIKWRTLKKRKYHTICRGRGKYKPLHIALDINSKEVYFSTSFAIYRIQYDGSLKKKIEDTRKPALLYYNQADASLYWSSVEQGGLIMCTKVGKNEGEKRVVISNVGYPDQLIGNGQLIFYRTFKERGVAVVTVEGSRLPSIAKETFEENSEILIAFPE